MSDPKPDASTELEPQRKTRVPVPITGQLQDLDSAWRYAEALAQSGLLPRELQNNTPNVLVVLLYGQYLGIPPVIATQVISVVNGRPQIAGKMLLAKVREAGHVPEIMESTDESCTVRITRGDDGKSYESTFTLKHAVKAGLCSIHADGSVRARSQSGKPLPWENYTSRMLMWRAVGHCVDVICPEVKLGFTVEGEETTASEDRPSLGKVAAARRVNTGDVPVTSPPSDVVDGEVVTDPETAKTIADLETRHTKGHYATTVDPDEEMWADVVAAETAAPGTES